MDISKYKALIYYPYQGTKGAPPLCLFFALLQGKKFLPYFFAVLAFYNNTHYVKFKAYYGVFPLQKGGKGSMARKKAPQGSYLCCLLLRLPFAVLVAFCFSYLFHFIAAALPCNYWYFFFAIIAANLQGKNFLLL